MTNAWNEPKIVETYECPDCGAYHDFTEADLPAEDFCCEHEHGALGMPLKVHEGVTVHMYVNAYEVGNAFGGPEEGGWSYEVGEPIACLPIKAVNTKELDGRVRPKPVMGLVGRAKMFLEEVLGAEGKYLKVRLERRFGQPYPASRPRYE